MSHFKKSEYHSHMLCEMCACTMVAFTTKHLKGKKNSNNINSNAYRFVWLYSIHEVFTCKMAKNRIHLFFSLARVFLWEKGTELSRFFYLALFFQFALFIIVLLLLFVRLRFVSIFGNHLWCVVFVVRKFATCFDSVQ